MTINPIATKFTPTVSCIMLLCCSDMTFAQKPADWKTTHDMSGSCQISFPSNWKVNEPPDGQAKTPEGTNALVVIGSSNKLQPLATDMQKLLLVDRIFENTSQRVFYVTKPTNDTVTYVLDVQGKKTRCKAQIEVRVGHSEAEIKQIAATVAENG